MSVPGSSPSFAAVAADPVTPTNETVKAPGLYAEEYQPSPSFAAANETVKAPGLYAEEHRASFAEANETVEAPAFRPGNTSPVLTAFRPGPSFA